MDFKHLQSFAAVIKYGSFTKAAEKLYISQPTISSHISALEAELNCSLLTRTTKSIDLTAKGQKVYEYAVHILELRDRMIRTCSEDHTHIIHLAASTIPSAYILPEILPEFGRLFPQTYFVIHQTESQGVMEGLGSGIFDIGMTGTKNEENLCYIPFCSDRMILITPVEDRFLKMQKLPELPLAQLLTEPIILREHGSGNSKSANHFLESIGVDEDRLQVTARINDQETIKNLVAGGLGISFISERAARNFIQEKRLLQFELPSNNRRSLYLAYRKSNELKPHVQEFIKYVLQKYQKSEAPVS